MPNIITHTLFAEDMLKDPVIESLIEHPHLYKVGSNGPDFLFFHHVNPIDFYKQTPLRKLGSDLHHENINEFYKAALKRIRNEKDAELKKQMISYLAGHLSHWALDSSAHPYIFYRTGNCHSRSSWNHHRMESLLDTFMLKVKKDGDIREFPLSLEVTETTREEKRAVALLYSDILNELYDQNITQNMIAQSLLDWQHYQRAIYDPKGWKFKVLKLAEKPANVNQLLSGLIVPTEAEDNYDLLNLMHREWKHPVTEESQFTSFLDLYDSAQNRAKTAITLFMQALEKPENEVDFLSFLGDRNYNMGVAGGEAHLFNSIRFE